MTQLSIYSITIIVSMIFMQMNHPLAMGLMLLIQTTLICLITGTLAKSFWFSYILFLVFLGGMLVLFVYVTSLASNEMFSLSPKMILSSITLLTAMMMTTILMDKTLLYTSLPNNEMLPMDMMNSYIKENTLDLVKLYNYPNNMITMILINYLLISLIAMVKITNVFYGPLRTMN